MNAQNDVRTVNVPQNVLFQDGTYTFEVTVVDYFGNSAKAVHSLTRAELSPPSIRLDVPQAIRTYSQVVTVLTVTAETNTCNSSSPAELLYAWQCVSHPGLLTGNTARLTIPAGLLTPGQAYIILISVTDAGTGLAVTELFELTVDRMQLQARIAGNTERALSTTALLVLDASGSSDPDRPGAALTRFEWAACYEGQQSPFPTSLSGICQPIPMTLGGVGLPPILQTQYAADPQLSIQGSTADPFPEGWWKFECTVRSDTRAATARTFVNFAPGVSAALQVSIQRVGAGAAAAHSAGVRLVLDAVPEGAVGTVGYLWTAVGSSQTEIDLTNGALAPTGAGLSSLVLTPFALATLSYVRVGVTISNAGVTATAQLLVIINSPPASGNLEGTVQATTGAGGQSVETVTLRAGYWVDDQTEPLRYQFYQYDPGSSGLRRALNDIPQLSNVLQVPAPVYADVVDLRYEVEVVDTFGAIAAAQTVLTISPQPVPPSELAVAEQQLVAAVDFYIGSAFSVVCHAPHGRVTRSSQGRKGHVWVSRVNTLRCP